MFLLSWSTEERKRRYVVIDRRIRPWFCLFLIYASVLTTSLASEGDEKTFARYLFHPSVIR